MRLSLTIVSENPLDREELNQIKVAIQEIIRDEIELELSVAIKL
jgi:F0F1-type ATP synthase delta subunit